MEVSGFNRLEQKLEELLNRLAALKEENASLKAHLDDKDQKIDELTNSASSMELERGEVRQRIQGLVDKLEAVGLD